MGKQCRKMLWRHKDNLTKFKLKKYDINKSKLNIRKSFVYCSRHCFKKLRIWFGLRSTTFWPKRNALFSNIDFSLTLFYETSKTISCIWLNFPGSVRTNGNRDIPSCQETMNLNFQQILFTNKIWQRHLFHSFSDWVLNFEYSGIWLPSSPGHHIWLRYGCQDIFMMVNQVIGQNKFVISSSTTLTFRADLEIGGFWVDNHQRHFNHSWPASECQPLW